MQSEPAGAFAGAESCRFATKSLVVFSQLAASSVMKFLSLARRDVLKTGRSFVASTNGERGAEWTQGAQRKKERERERERGRLIRRMRPIDRKFRPLFDLSLSLSVSPSRSLARGSCGIEALSDAGSRLVARIPSMIHGGRRDACSAKNPFSPPPASKLSE